MAYCPANPVTQLDARKVLQAHISSGLAIKPQENLDQNPIGLHRQSYCNNLQHLKPAYR